MNTLLKQTKLKGFVHHLANGEQVVRNRKVNALIESKVTGIDPKYKRVLATPIFTGTEANETISWQTDQFTSNPYALKDLRGDRRQHYKEILQQVMQQYAAALNGQSEDMRNLLLGAITYHSLDNVFCADDKVVLTEWGMHPKEKTVWNTLLSADIGQDSSAQSAVQQDGGTAGITTSNSSAGGNTPTDRDESASGNTPSDRDESAGGNNSAGGTTVVGGTSASGTTGSNSNGTTTTSTGSDIAGGTNVIGPTTTEPRSKSGNKWSEFWKKWKKWILWSLLLLLLLLLLLIGLSRCSSEDGVGGMLPLPPAIDPSKDVSISDDSLYYEVNNRVTLIIEEGSVLEFAKDFRTVYPDKDKYMLVCPDTIIPRVMVVFPKEERKEFLNSLDSKFSKWKLIVIPEALFEGTALPVNDPALSDAKKRWYFDLCGIENAWKETMGDPEVVVAVIDDGFDLSHPELKGQVLDTYNSVTHTSKVFPSDVGHGQHVACTVAGVADNSEGTSGIAPKCKLILIQISDENGLMTTSSVLDGMLFAIKKKASVVNMSFGMQFSPLIQFLPIPYQKNFIANMFLDEEKFWNKVFNMGEAQGTTFVKAAGNQNILTGMDPQSRCSQTIKVAAVQPDRSKAEFSNFGDGTTISAPGVDIYNAVPSNKYEFMDGTSMAAPITTGAVALLKSMNKSWKTADIIKILQRTGLRSTSAIPPIVHFGTGGIGVPDEGVDPVTGLPSPVDPTKPGGPKKPGEDKKLPVTEELPDYGGMPVGGGDGASPDCEKYQKRYNELLVEMEKLKREHPECIAEPDTMKIPVDAKLSDITGLWKSTTSLYNEEDEEIVLYFQFTGSPNGTIFLVEPDGTRYSAPLKVTVGGDKIYMEQLAQATGPGPREYDPYTFVCKPDKNRTAVCHGKNLTNAANQVYFNLVRLSH